MGANFSKSKKKHNKCKLYQSEKHCCLADCFVPVSNASKLNYTSLWYFSRKHENALVTYLSEYGLTDIVMVIMEYLENYKSSTNDTTSNYKIFARSYLSILNYDRDDNGICSFWLSNKYIIKCAVLGDYSVGKTTLITKFLCDRFLIESDPTIEDSYLKTIPINVDRKDMDEYIPDSGGYKNWLYVPETGKYKIHKLDDESKEKLLLLEKYKDRQHVTLDILDTVGDNAFHIIDRWIRESSIFFLVFDVTRKESFDLVMREYESIVRVKDPVWDHTHDYVDFAIIAVGNKCDLRVDCNYDGFIEETAMKWFRKQQIPYIETSAKTGRNVNLLFRQAVYEYWIQTHSGCMPHSK